jgi:H2-forming N5,N10-methylenetetrahydromethanopterin dehydrogenase-like enzyme
MECSLCKEIKEDVKEKGAICDQCMIDQTELHHEGEYGC